MTGNVGAVRGCSCSAPQHCKGVRRTLIQTGGERLFTVRRCVQPSFPQHCQARWSEKLQSELFSVGQNKSHQLGRKRRPRWLGLSHEINRKQLRPSPASCAVSAEFWSAFLILANRRFVQSASFFCWVPWICEIFHLVYLDTFNRLKRNLVKFC